MNQLLHLLKFDLKLLQKYQVVLISIIVTAVYVGVFKGLSNLGNVDQLLILLIFNDPALLGFLFVGVLILFEKSEHTLQALSVTPIKLHNYLLSKTIVLTIIGVLCCYAMVIATRGTDVHWLSFTLASLFATFIFSMFGFIAVADQNNFNKYILKATGIILGLALPFLGYFEVLPNWLFWVFPTWAPIQLYDLSFQAAPSWSAVALLSSTCLVWSVVTYLWAYRLIQKYIFTS
ncbi:MAG: hypothetical protein AAGI23_00235 [Bacteroidota bacterium]